MMGKMLRRAVLRVVVAAGVGGLVSAGSAFGAHSGQITVCHTDCDYTQLQPAINAAHDGSSIAVGAGTYDGSLTISKGLQIRGSGAANTTIAGVDLKHAVVTVDGGKVVKLFDLTIAGGQNSQGHVGGGLANNGGTVTLSNSVVRDNTASAWAGGIFNHAGEITLIDSTVSHNSVVSDDKIVGLGGGIFNAPGATLTLSGSTISDNAAGLGGGIYADGNVNLSTTNVERNHAVNGGGIATGVKWDGKLVVMNSRIVDNTAHGQAADPHQGLGGGILVGRNGSAMLDGTRVRRNDAHVGGGIWALNGGVTLRDESSDDISKNTPDNCSGTKC